MIACCSLSIRSCIVAVCCSVLQCVAVCYSVLQCVAVCCSVLQCVAVCCKQDLLLGALFSSAPACCSALRYVAHVAVHCNVAQCVAVRCSALQGVAVRCSALQRVAARCSALQRVAARCSALQRVAARCRRDLLHNSTLLFFHALQRRLQILNVLVHTLLFRDIVALARLRDHQHTCVKTLPDTLQHTTTHVTNNTNVSKQVMTCKATRKDADAAFHRHGHNT